MCQGIFSLSFNFKAATPVENAADKPTYPM